MNIFTVRFLYYLNLYKILFVYVGIAVGAYSRKLAQLLILAKKSTKNFTLPPPAPLPPNSVPFLSVLLQNKALHNFH